MNCPECLDFLQRRLDGVDDAVPADLERHLAGCADCRAWFAAADRLQEGLRCQAAPRVPAYLTDAIVRALVTHERRRRRRRWLAAGAAVAAGVSIALLIGYRGGQPSVPQPGPQAHQDNPAPTDRPLPTPESPSLRRSVQEARSAVAALTEDLTTSTRRLLGSATSPLQANAFAPLPTVADLEQPLQPAARSLRDSGRGVSISLATVTGSARRAMDYFFQELPVLPSAKKAGL
jgi:anti-sigma factor RsiW